MQSPRERQQKENEKADMLRSLELREHYRATFSTVSGRVVLEDLVLQGHMLETTCSGNAWSYFYEGERNFVLRLGSYIPDLVGQVFSEIMARKQGEINTQTATLLRDGESKE